MPVTQATPFAPIPNQYALRTEGSASIQAALHAVCASDVDDGCRKGRTLYVRAQCSRSSMMSRSIIACSPYICHPDVKT